MLRELQVVLNKNIDAMFKAEVDMETGMGVVKDHVNKTVGFPTAETADIYFVSKERIPYGIDCVRGDISDYDDAYTKVKTGEFVKLHAPMPGERYAVDQYDETGLDAGVAVTVTSDGKFKKATVASNLIFTGFYTDAGHRLATIEVAGKEKTNA